MAIASVGTAGSGISTSASSSVAATVNATLAVGRLVVAIVAKDNIQTTDGDPSEVTSVADTRSNVWTKAREFCNGQGGVAAGADVAIYYTVVTTQIEVADAVTANLSANVQSKAISLWYYSLAAGSLVSVAGGADLANDGADPGNITVGGLASAEYLWVRAIATESNSTTALTVTAGFTVMTQAVANTGTSATSMGVRGEFIIATATTKSSDPTLFGSTDMASTMVAFSEVPAQSITPAALALAATFPTMLEAQTATLAVLALAATFPTASLAPTIPTGPLALAATFPTTLEAQTVAPAALALTAAFPSTALGQTTTASALALAATFPSMAPAIGVPTGALALSATFPSTTLAVWVPPVLAGPVPTGLTVRTYDGATGAPIDEWVDVVDCDVTFGEHGPEQATVTLPYRTDAGALNPALHRRRLMPGNRGVLVEIDARGLDIAEDVGLDEVWLGRAKSAPRGSGKATVQVSCQGPHTWLERETVPARVPFRGAAGRVFRDVLAGHPNGLHLVIGDVDDGPAVDVTLSGATLWEAITGLEEQTLGRAYFTAIPGAAKLVAQWRDQLSTRDDLTDRVVLIDGVNCEWDADCDLDPPFDTMLVAGRSFGDATTDGVVSARAPGGPVLGKLAALTAAVSSPVASALAGQGGSQVRPDLGALASLYSQADAGLRGQLQQAHVASIRVTDTSLWRSLRVGRIVEVRLEDPMGVFTHALVEIQQMTVGLAPDKTLDLGVELWAVME